MIKLSQKHRQAKGANIRFQLGAAVSAIILCLVSIETNAQEENESCPCFSYEEVESIFLRALQLTTEEGESNCKAEDYSVECAAEIVIWDKNYTETAHVQVEWFDFDPGLCAYTDSIGNPGVERDVRWPHPAPEATARACYDIIASVIAKSDSAGKCFTTQ